MGVRRRLLRELLSSLKYIKNLTEQQIRASLWRGEATLCNLELEPRQLQQLFHDAFPCGLEILRATVKEVSVRIPWHQIMTQSILIVASDIEVEAVVHCEDEEEWREAVAAMHRKYLRTQHDRIEHAPASSLTSSPVGAFDQLRQRLVDGVQIQVSSATLSLLSKHHRHRPSHGQSCESEPVLQEVLRICGNEIILSPSDANRAPCHKLKGMATFCPKSRQLTLNKFLKCRLFRILPGCGHNACPLAAKEFMETPVSLTCHITQSYASDGSSMCPFLLRSSMLFELQGPLHVRGCECQLRAFTALVMDVGRLEEWRLSEALLRARPERGDAAAAAGEVLVNTSSLARTFAKGQRALEAEAEAEQPAPAPGARQAAAGAGPAAAAATAKAEPAGEGPGEAAAKAEPAAAQGAAGGGEAAAAAPRPRRPAEPRQPEPARAEAAEAPSAEAEAARAVPRPAAEATGGEAQAPRATAAPAAREAPPKAKQHGREAHALQPEQFGSSRGAAGPTGGPPGRTGAGGPLEDTSSVARTYAQGAESRRHAEQGPTKSSLPMAAALWKTLWQAPGLLSRGPRGSPREAPGRPLREEDLREMFGTAAAAQGDAAFEVYREPASRKTSASGQGGPQRQQNGMLSGNACVEEAQGAQWEEPEAIEDGEDHEVEPEFIVDSDEDEGEFDDADDYFSAGSVASGDLGEALEGQSPPAHTRWLTPVFKWLSSDKAAHHAAQHWPKVTEAVKEISLTFSHLVMRLTAASAPDAESADVIELRLDGCVWTANVHLGLTDAQLECLHRLARPAEERAHVPRRLRLEDVGPQCLQRQLPGAQSMRWPCAVLVLRGAEDEVELLRPRGPERQLAAEPMLAFAWRPRSAPGLLMDSTAWISHTWPVQACLRNARLVADPGMWATVRTCYERCKPMLASKLAAPALAPPLAPRESGEFFPVESIFLEMIDCDAIEPERPSTMLEQKRWPLHVTIPRLTLRSNSDKVAFGELLAQWSGALPVESREEDPAAARSTVAGSGQAGGQDDRDVTIPKEMFDLLVHRAAEATLKDSHVAAAREELQKAYIALAGLRATSAQGSSGLAGHGEPERQAGGDAQASASAAEVGELERLRRKCAQLESSLQSQCLAQRRLETELSNYQALARDEMRQLLCTRAREARSRTPGTSGHCGQGQH